MRTIGIIGHGYVGKAMEAFFRASSTPFEIRIFDKVGGTPAQLLLAARSEIVFVCVPTPMAPDGRCHTSIVESVLQQLGEFLPVPTHVPHTIVLKSTVPPGFTDKVSAWGQRDILFSPEFLTEKNSIADMLTTNRIVLGGARAATARAAEFFRAAQPDRVVSGALGIHQCTAMEAELVKLFANGMLATKVTFSNEMAAVCAALRVEYDRVRELATLDPRIGASHTTVPGPDGFPGFGGHCLPKDLASLRTVARELGVHEVLFSAVLRRNDELRRSPEARDWEGMVGRAVL